jgi:microcystin-dependent protein
MAPTPKVQIKRTTIANHPPPNGSLSPGEFALEMADPTRLWVGVPVALDASGMKLLTDSTPGPATGVNVSGTPTNGQIAQWTDATHIKGVDPVAVSGWSTGDAKLTLKNVPDPGWVLMQDGTIGSATSGASNRANADCQPLFILMFNNITDAWCPITTSTGAATTRAAQGTAAAAWAANCRMALPRQLGRTLAVGGAGSGLTNRQLGSTLGVETHIQTISEMPSHVHTYSDPGHSHGVVSAQPLVIGNPGAPTVAVDGGAVYGVPSWNGMVPANDSTQFTAVSAVTNININPNGGGQPMSMYQPTTHWNIMIKL